MVSKNARKAGRGNTFSFMEKDLSKNILATICYYDAMDYPLTSFEIWKYLITHNPQPITRNPAYSLLDVVSELEGAYLNGFIENYNGFYFLKGRKELVEKRLARNKISVAKIKKLEKSVRILRFVPFIRMIGITGRLAMKNAGKNSDLDILVVLKSGRIWTGRLLTALAMHILGKRRHGEKIADRVCLNYFITDGSLEIMLKDLFSSSEYSFMLPVFGNEVFSDFQKNNRWIKNYRPNFCDDEAIGLKLAEDNFFSKNFRKLGEKFFGFDLLENTLKKWQIGRIKQDPRTIKFGSGVVADDAMLIFLPDPKGPRVYEKFREKMDSLT